MGVGKTGVGKTGVGKMGVGEMGIPPSGGAVAQWLACWPFNGRVTGLILPSFR